MVREGSKGDFLAVRELAASATWNSTTFSIPDTILDIRRCMEGKEEGVLDRSSSTPEIEREEVDSGSGTGRPFGILI